MLVPISGQVTGQPEADNVAQVASGKHFGGGIWTMRFERAMAEYMGTRFAAMTNSGSSAILLSLLTLELSPGSRVLTCAVNFPTTVNAIIQLGHIPVFIDADPKTLNAVPFNTYTADAAIFAHTLGNPIDFPDVPYPIIEDCCDALGSTIHNKTVGRRGVFATSSFYPAHHITTGEGGMAYTDDPGLNKILKSYRDWGRDCWCEPGKDNTCGKRRDGEYDHKYTYSRIGYNLKASEFQAAVGLAQLDRLSGFVQKRRENWQYLRDGLSDMPLEFVEATPDSSPSWFGFPFMTDRRNELAQFLDSKQIGNRPIMGGNLLRQPAYKAIRCEILNGTKGADKIHEQGLWIGCFPGITVEMIDYVIEAFNEFF